MVNKLTFAALAVLLSLSGCSMNSEEHRANVKFNQYMVEGERLYQQHCSNCHQLDGKGVGKLFPPLAGSDFFTDSSQVICLIRNGIEGELIVNGQSYNQPMPGIPSLTDLEVAEITTYILNAWGNNGRMVNVKEVSRTPCKK